MLNQTSRIDKTWGYYIDYFRSPTMVIKEIVIAPGQQISHQKHYDRKEYWEIVSGEGMLSLNGEISTIKAGSNFFVDKEDWHQVKSTGLEPLFCIEVQIGIECVENDIIRGPDAL